MVIALITPHGNLGLQPIIASLGVGAETASWSLCPLSLTVLFTVFLVAVSTPLAGAAL